ncbi:hypothetical protein J1N35_023328 [Gossypium stocksii]|uniref:Uncharacterized protein n=1 Tax=Gossypium stocksii TaxID=47602 RepID=A0A9D3VJH5_9ROSI|nr:hypothetical protein J1N35_023328 [Gossypium stocksii]
MDGTVFYQLKSLELGSLSRLCSENYTSEIFPSFKLTLLRGTEHHGCWKLEKDMAQPAIHMEEFQLKDTYYRKAKIEGKVEIFALENRFIKSYGRCPFHWELKCYLLEYVAAAQLQPYSMI